jgi:D-alanyl-D-alanine endopeptidase (penicillin-binding protein 7)
MKRSLSIWLMGLGVAASAQALDTSTTAPSQSSASARKAAAVSTASASRRTAAASLSASKAPAAAVEPARASFGQMQGLHAEADPLALKSGVALVIDQDTNEVLLSKNSQAVLPIASITKLMTALVVTDAHQSMSEVLTITQEDIDTEKGSRSRLAVGTQLTRGEMLHLALMASENRAANALGRHYEGGMEAFVAAMNQRAQGLGMTDTHYVEPTGLSSKNQSSAHDLAILVGEAHQNAVLREFSTSADAKVAVGKRIMQFHNTNGLVHSRQWDIGLQKTGYISEAGRCVVMQAQLAGRKLIMVLLDSTGKYSRIGDAERIRKWLEMAATKMVRPLS